MFHQWEEEEDWKQKRKKRKWKPDQILHLIIFRKKNTLIFTFMRKNNLNDSFKIKTTER